MVPTAWQGSRAAGQGGKLDSSPYPGCLAHCCGLGSVVQRDPPFIHSCGSCADFYVSPAADWRSDRCWDCSVGALLSQVGKPKL